ncbi:hypothetical protein [Spongiactinospora sp. TRM90649]|uniref:hypothetical protein n=1 Tax=Spongiactinospora sp. TRM90649 TaxID=3031114 RepID=UPI0023F6E13B|nr:hypothetical protein [Spongiactinospora sp. TRM90649]MDF5758434.1 hypothetical protein [Spongiactinospora sp. TRM90649]
MGVSLGKDVARTIEQARHADYAASAELVCQLQRGQRLTAEPLFMAVYCSAVRAWWDLVDLQICQEGAEAAHAVRRVRVRARHYLTGQPVASRAGTLFDHALAHASRAAARYFLARTGELFARAAQSETAHTGEERE